MLATIRIEELSRGRAWEVYENDQLVIRCGVVRATLLGDAEFWMEPLGQFSFSLRRLAFWAQDELAKLYPKLVAHVDPEIACHKRFAEFFGFRVVGSEPDANGKMWLRYEKWQR